MGIKKDFINGSLWSAGTQYIFFGFNFIGQIFLARLLLPEYFGIIALALSIAGILELFLSFSVSMGYIYLPDSETLFSSALFLSLLIWSVMFIVSLAAYFPLYKIYGFEIALFVELIVFFSIFSSISHIYLARLEKNMAFKKSSLIAGAGGFIGMVSAVVSAYLGLKEYSLLIREIGSSLMVFLFLKFYNGQIILSFINYDKNEIKALFKYSTKIFFSRSSEMLYFRVPFLFIGTFYGGNVLGFISQMFYLSGLFNTALSMFTSKVSFVFFSKYRNEVKKMKKLLLYINLLIIISALPVFVVFYFFPGFILKILWGSKWVDGAIYLKMLAVFTVFLPIFSSLKSYYYGLGKNVIMAYLYMFGLIVYFAIVLIWKQKNILSFSFSLSMAVITITAAVIIAVKPTYFRLRNN